MDRWSIHRGRSSVARYSSARNSNHYTGDLWLAERKDNTVILQTVSFDAGSGWALGDANEPMDSTRGPEVEIVITGETTIYRTNYEVSQSSIQQVVREAALDELNSQMMITVWGRKDGDRIIADLLLAEHLKE